MALGIYHVGEGDLAIAEVIMDNPDLSIAESEDINAIVTIAFPSDSDIDIGHRLDMAQTVLNRIIEIGTSEKE